MAEEERERDREKDGWKGRSGVTETARIWDFGGK